MPGFLSPRPRARRGRRKGASESTRRDFLRIVIIGESGIDEERHGEFLPLARHQQLLGEAEALDLVEVLPDLQRRHVVGRGAEAGLRAAVDRRERNLAPLAETNLDWAGRREAPRQIGRNIGIEAHLHGRSGCGPGRGRGNLCGSGKPGHLAEHPIERNSGVGESDHRRNHRNRGRYGNHVAAPQAPDLHEPVEAGEPFDPRFHDPNRLFSLSQRSRSPWPWGFSISFTSALTKTTRLVGSNCKPWKFARQCPSLSITWVTMPWV